MFKISRFSMSGMCDTYAPQSSLQTHTGLKDLLLVFLIFRFLASCCLGFVSDEVEHTELLHHHISLEI